MSVWSFTLAVSPPTMDDEEVVDRLCEAGCDDATFCVFGGMYRLDFDREAVTLQDAMVSAIDDLANAEIGSSVCLVEMMLVEIRQNRQERENE
jgi:hypothetical protein